jgi:heat shock protein HslJ
VSKKIGLFFVGFIIMAGCSNKTEIETLYIQSFKKKCVGVGPMNCLQVKKSEDAAWENFYDDIVGFDYIPGYLYTIEVQVDKVVGKNIPADKSSFIYRLHKVVSKEVDRKLRINDIWVASHINGTELQKSNQLPQIEISVKDLRLYGNDACNEIRASIELITETKVSFGGITGTKKLCKNMEIPDAFVKALEKVSSYKIAKRKLYFFDDKDNEILRLIKID